MTCNLVTPPPIRAALDAGAALAISISGGKDSQAMLYEIMDANLPNPVFAIHAHLGEMEWKMSQEHCQKMCDEVGIELVTVHREQGDLLEHIKYRQEQLRGQGKPHWPSAAARYCTSDHKRTPIDKYLRRFDLIISAEGLRARESDSRAKKEFCQPRKQICTRTRQAFNWYPILHWSHNEVWDRLSTNRSDLRRRQELYRQGEERDAFDGWIAHPAYVYGNERVSCAICVLGSQNDIINGAKHNPQLFQELVAMEESSGFSFRQNLRLGDLEIT